MLNLIVNPNAGKGLAKKNIKKVTKYLKKEKVPYLVYFLEKENDLEEFVNSICEAEENEFVIVGGDGTIHKFINCVPNLNKINFGIIPSGKHNDFAKILKIEFNPIKAIQNILNNHIENFDYIKCNDINVCNCVAFGLIESTKFDIVNEGKKNSPGVFDYLKNLKTFEPLQINFFGEEVNEKNILIKQCYICNGSNKGASYVSPLSNPQDGLCNIICVTKKANNGLIRDYMQIKKGSHIYHNENKIYWANGFNLTSSKVPIKAEIDGELYDFEELSIKVIEGGLRIYVE